MYTALEILKYTLPALIVFATVYYLMKGFFDAQYKQKSLELSTQQYDKTLPLKLQAYERLALLCERISLDNLAFRLTNSSADGKSLGQAMMVAIQQEWEHNLSQQIYVSDALWKIITIAKNQQLAAINDALRSLPEGAGVSNLMETLTAEITKDGIDAMSSAKTAIREETQTLF